MATSRATAASGSTAIRKYMDGKISSKEYFRQVRRDTSREVRRELDKDTTKRAKT
jgi:hypothetical protein